MSRKDRKLHSKIKSIMVLVLKAPGGLKTRSRGHSKAFLKVLRVRAVFAFHMVIILYQKL